MNIKKITEAEYFINKIKEGINSNSREDITNNTSAFVTAARSALQYALKEAKTVNGGEQWYISKTSHNDLIVFFKKIRNINIHERQVLIPLICDLFLEERITIGVSFSAISQDKHGNIYNETKPIKPISSNSLARETSSRTLYTLEGWTGNEDVVELCQLYIDEVKNIILEGRTKSYLS